MKITLEAMKWAADAVRKWALVTLAIVLGFYGAAMVSGCAAVRPACIAIDAAHAACAVLTFVDSAGNEHTVRLSHDDLTFVGQAVSAQHPGSVVK